MKRISLDQKILKLALKKEYNRDQFIAYWNDHTSWEIYDGVVEDYYLAMVLPTMELISQGWLKNISHLPEICKVVIYYHLERAPNKNFKEDDREYEARCVLADAKMEVAR